jgi:hypothetical protein
VTVGLFENRPEIFTPFHSINALGAESVDVGFQQG